jgi:hypothetical protein
MDEMPLTALDTVELTSLDSFGDCDPRPSADFSIEMAQLCERCEQTELLLLERSWQAGQRSASVMAAWLESR